MHETTVKLGPNNAGQRISAAEFAVAEFQPPYVYERIQGRLAVMSPAGPEHRQVSRPFRRELGGYWHQHPQRVDDVDIDGWVATSPADDRIPDICIYLAGESSGESAPNRVPDLIIEFVSADRADQERDYIDKRSEYHAIGVKEYVIVDRFKQGALVLQYRPDEYAEHWLGIGDEYSSDLLPGLRVSMAEAFR